MSNTNRYRSNASALIALLMSAVAPIVSVAPATAQLFPTQPTQPTQRYPRPTTPANQVVIPVGTTIPLKYDEAEKILVTRDETVPITVTVAANVRTSDGTILIPYNSRVVGQIEPAGSGSQFVAQELIIDSGSPLPIEGTSRIVTTTETVEEGAGAGDILEGAAIGAAAAAVIAEITGDIGVAEVLGGAGLGALAGLLLGGDQAELISIDPNTDLNVTLSSPLALR